MSQYLTKTELAKRWSNSLIDSYFPICSLEKPNPKYRGGSPMQLYDLGRVRYIESTDAFKADYKKVLKRKIAARERTERKREKQIMYANGVQIMVPDYEKDKLIKKACEFYNACMSKGVFCCDGEKATPSSNESFIKKIVIYFLRFECSYLNDEFDTFFKRVGKNKAFAVLQGRILDAIKQKYDWLR